MVLRMLMTYSMKKLSVWDLVVISLAWKIWTQGIVMKVSFDNGGHSILKKRIRLFLIFFDQVNLGMSFVSSKLRTINTKKDKDVNSGVLKRKLRGL